MAALENVLATLAEQLRQDGAQHAPRALDVLSAVTRFLTAVNTLILSDEGSAAYLAAQLQPEEARKAAISLGIPPELIPNVPTGMGCDVQLANIVARGAQPNSIVAATVLYVLHMVAASKGDVKRMSQLANVADIATSQGSQNPGLAATLQTEMSKTLPASATSMPVAKTNCLYSISIDLVASTDAKSRIAGMASGNSQRIDSLNEHIYSEFCRIESAFYKAACDSHRAGRAVSPARLFTVKGIGDEIWILCEASEDEVPYVGRRLIEAAIDIAQEFVDFIATQNDDKGAFDSDFDYGLCEPITAPVKVFIDLVRHASSLGRKRDERLLKEIPDLLKRFHGRDGTPGEIAAIARRLGFSSYEPLGWSLSHEFRTDYIGHEIDRFFRTTKAAIPGTVTIGASMARSMNLLFNQVENSVHAVNDCNGQPICAGLMTEQVHSLTRQLGGSDMKGIGYAYDTYTLFLPRALRTMYHRMDILREQGQPFANYGDTAKLIPLEVVERLITLQPNVR